MAEKRPRTRPTYHHGDLRAALIEAGITRAREGGPDAVVLREVARMVGVAPNSAYAHFGTLTDLKKAVADRARVEMAKAMSAQLDALDLPAARPDAAKAYLREVGRAYVRFALTEPGLFRTGMGGDPTGLTVPVEAPPEDDRLKPKVLLLRALDELVEAGCMPAGDTARAVIASWAIVHGLATMLLDLLPQLTPEQRDAAVDDAIDVLIAGLTPAIRR